MKLSDQITRRHLFVAFGTSAQTGSLSSVDLAATRDNVSVALTASDGSVAPIAAADASTAGVMAAADKVKLDSLPPTTARDFLTVSDITVTGIDDAITHLRTAGRSSPGDGGSALFRRVGTQPAHPAKIQSADGTWWELVPDPTGLGARQLGATGDGTTDDAAALADWLGALALRQDLVLSPGVYLTGAALTATDGPHRLIGAGWQIEHGPSTVRGTAIKAASTAVADLLTIQSTTPGSQSSTARWGLHLADFALLHRGAGAGLKLDNIYKALVENVHVRCNPSGTDEGAIGIEIDNFAFFLTLFKCHVHEFTNTGVLIRRPGSQHALRECHISATNATAVAALEIQTFDFLVDGGQYNVRRPSGTQDGIGILVNNVTGESNLVGGRIRNIICEEGISVKIDGTTQPMKQIVVETPSWNMNMVAKGIVFGNAVDCVLLYPQVFNPTGGGVLAEWEANSFNCGIVVDRQAAKAPITVNASASKAWKHVTGIISLSERDNNVTTDPNLITTCEWVEDVGPCVHNGTAWDAHRVSLADDTAASFTPPTPNGYVEIMAHAGLNIYWMGTHSTASTQAMVAGADNESWASNGALTGTTGTDGKMTVRMNSADGKFYIENRTGTTKIVLVRFKRPVA